MRAQLTIASPLPVTLAAILAATLMATLMVLARARKTALGDGRTNFDNRMHL